MPEYCHALSLDQAGQDAIAQHIRETVAEPPSLTSDRFSPGLIASICATVSRRGMFARILSKDPRTHCWGNTRVTELPRQAVTARDKVQQ